MSSNNNRKKQSGKGLSYNNVEHFMHPKNIPKEIEEEILNCYVEFNINSDMTINELGLYFEKLDLPKSIYKFVIYKGENDLCVPGTNIVDFDKLLIETYHLLIYMDNINVIDEYWSLLIESCERDKKFPKVKLRDHAIGLKQLRTILNNVSGPGEDDKSTQSSKNSQKDSNTFPLIQMMKVAASSSFFSSSPFEESHNKTEKLFINYLDFACLLGKIGLLNYL